MQRAPCPWEPRSLIANACTLLTVYSLRFIVVRFCFCRRGRDPRARARPQTPRPRPAPAACLVLLPYIHGGHAMGRRRRPESPRRARRRVRGPFYFAIYGDRAGIDRWDRRASGGGGRPKLLVLAF